jgi:hypothetical protein
MSWLRSEADSKSAWAYEKHRNGGMGGRFGRAWACTASELGGARWTRVGQKRWFVYSLFFVLAVAGFAGILPVC